MNPESPRNPPPARRPATVLESVEEIRAQVRAAAPRTVAEGHPSNPAAAEARPFRPTLRPPMASLCVMDDGEDGGEVVRIRGGTFVIGRVDGDLVVPHDGGISGRHAEISRRFENGAWAWFLKDLQSTNGTFVRATTVLLQHDQELLIGSRRFRFEAPPAAADAAPPPERANATRKWDAPPARTALAARPPALVEIAQGSEARRFTLTEREYVLGRDPRLCSIVVDDPMTDARHARLLRDDRTGRWVIANERSVNGLWAGVSEIGLGRGAFFQCGEQRFLLKVL